MEWIFLFKHPLKVRGSQIHVSVKLKHFKLNLSWIVTTNLCRCAPLLQIELLNCHFNYNEPCFLLHKLWAPQLLSSHINDPPMYRAVFWLVYDIHKYHSAKTAVEASHANPWIFIASANVMRFRGKNSVDSISHRHNSLCVFVSRRRGKAFSQSSFWRVNPCAASINIYIYIYIKLSAVLSDQNSQIRTVWSERFVHECLIALQLLCLHTGSIYYSRLQTFLITNCCILPQWLKFQSCVWLYAVCAFKMFSFSLCSFSS